MYRVKIRRSVAVALRDLGFYEAKRDFAGGVIWIFGLGTFAAIVFSVGYAINGMATETATSIMATIFGGCVCWYFARKKRRSEVEVIGLKKWNLGLKDPYWDQGDNDDEIELVDSLSDALDDSE